MGISHKKEWAPQKRVGTSHKKEWPRTVQRWCKSSKKDPDSLFKNIGRPRIIEPEGELAEAAKGLVTDLYFKQPPAIVDQLMEQLANNFEDFSLPKRAVYR